MTLEELKNNWENYAWEWAHKGKRVSMLLSRHYYKCELKTLKDNTKCLAFFLRFDDGSWAHEWDLLKTDSKGNCYLHTFLTRNINKFRWFKRGHFVKIK